MQSSDHKPKTESLLEPNRTDTMQCNVTFSFRGLDVWYDAISPSLDINFFNKTLSSLLSVIKKNNKNGVVFC